MSEGEPDFAFPLNRVFYVLLDSVLLGVATEHSLNFQDARAVGVLDGALDEIPHSLALFAMGGLLDQPHATMLLLGLCINKTIPQVDLPESFGLFSEICFSNSAVSEAVFKFLHGQFVGGLYVGPCGKAKYIANILSFTLLSSD